MSYAETEYTYGFSVKSNSLESAFRIFVGLELTEIRPAKAIKKTRTKSSKIRISWLSLNYSSAEHTNRRGKAQFLFRSGLRFSVGQVPEEICPRKV